MARFIASVIVYLISVIVLTVYPSIANSVTYYVAVNEPGADNETCDGLSPVNKGNGHCPFKDFTSLTVRSKLYLTKDGNFGTRSVQMKVRRGKYKIEPMKAFANEPAIALLIYSAAKTKEEAVVLTNYKSEKVILDGRCSPAFPECNSPLDPADPKGRIWMLMQTAGNWVTVQGLTFDNAHKWNILLGSVNTHILSNKFVGPYGSDSDSIKAAERKGPVLIDDNEFVGQREQAIDGTTAHDWLITRNYFHDGIGGIGFKFEARNVVIRNNRFHRLARSAISLGGGSSPHPGHYEAWRIRAEYNEITGIKDHAVQFVNCYNCSFSYNDVTRAAMGVNFGDADTVSSGCKNGTGCLPSTLAKIVGNRFRDIKVTSDGRTFQNAFIFADIRTVDTLKVGNNVYCVADGTDPHFYRGAKILGFTQWRAAVGDEGSNVVKRSDAACTQPFAYGQ